MRPARRLHLQEVAGEFRAHHAAPAHPDSGRARGDGADVAGLPAEASVSWGRDEGEHVGVRRPGCGAGDGEEGGGCEEEIDGQGELVRPDEGDAVAARED